MTSRHDRVWLSAAGWQAAAAAVNPEQRAAVERWAGAGWPLVVRRDDVGTTDDQVCLGLAEPPDPAGVKRRIALCAARRHIAHTLPALALADAAPAAPPAWTDALAALQRAATDLDLRAYGSLALQAITGQAYLGAHSDIDLLFYPLTQQQLHTGLQLLARHARDLPLDGEIVFPNGAAVAWREWAGADQAGSRVLVKALRALRLAPRAALLASLP